MKECYLSSVYLTIVDLALFSGKPTQEPFLANSLVRQLIDWLLIAYKWKPIVMVMAIRCMPHHNLIPCLHIARNFLPTKMIDIMSRYIIDCRHQEQVTLLEVTLNIQIPLVRVTMMMGTNHHMFHQRPAIQTIGLILKIMKEITDQFPTIVESIPGMYTTHQEFPRMPDPCMLADR
jgi:hypothetical protein